MLFLLHSSVGRKCIESYPVLIGSVHAVAEKIHGSDTSHTNIQRQWPSTAYPRCTSDERNLISKPREDVFLEL